MLFCQLLFFPVFFHCALPRHGSFDTFSFGLAEKAAGPGQFSGTIKAWLHHYQKKNAYHQPSEMQHGRPSFLSAKEKNELMESIEKLGARPNAAPIRGRGVAAIARGIISRTTPQVCAF